MFVSLHVSDLLLQGSNAFHFAWALLERQFERQLSDARWRCFQHMTKRRVVDVFRPRNRSDRTVHG